MLGFRLLWGVSFLVFWAARFQIAAARLFNTTLQSTAPQIVWSPALCNASLNDVNCSSAWRISDDVPGARVTSTNGPDPGTGDIIPQMFLSFRGSAIYIRTSALSNATANITLSSPVPGTFYMDVQVDSSIEWISAAGLPQDSVLTLGITYVPNANEPNGDGGRLDIDSITITVANVSATSSNLPSMTLPASSCPLIFSQTPSARPAPKQSKGPLVGKILGPLLGVLLFVSTGVAIVFWRRRKRRMEMEAATREWGDYERGRRSI